LHFGTPNNAAEMNCVLQLNATPFVGNKKLLVERALGLSST